MRSKPEATMLVTQMIAHLIDRTEPFDPNDEFHNGARSVTAHAISIVWEETFDEGMNRLISMIREMQTARDTADGSPVYGAAHNPQQPPPRVKRN